MEDRRECIRVDESLRINYKLLESFLSTSSKSKNISLGGICLPVFQRLDPGIVLALEIHLRNFSKPIVAVGEVVWRSEKEGLKPTLEFPFEIGIRFIKIKLADRNRLIKHIEDKTRKGEPTGIDWFSD